MNGYGYYDYCPDDATVQFITSGKPQLVHLFTRDGKYVGTITDPLIVSRAVKHWKPATVDAVRLFLVMIAECFPEKIVKMEIDDLPPWHPLLPISDKRPNRARIRFIDGPLLGQTYTCKEFIHYLMLHVQSDFQDDWHLYSLNLDPSNDCGYYHMLSGTKEQVDEYCVKNNIRCFIGG